MSGRTFEYLYLLGQSARYQSRTVLRWDDDAVEKFSRTALAGLAVGAAGQGAAMLVLAFLGPFLVVASSPETSGGAAEVVGSLLVGLVLGSLLALPFAYVAGLAATYAALRLTGCPRPQVALALCAVLSIPWLGMLSMLDVDVTGFVALAGLLPAGVRVGFGLATPTQVLVNVTDTPTDLAQENRSSA